MEIFLNAIRNKQNLIFKVMLANANLDYQVALCFKIAKIQLAI